jgi:hypothetical protein
VLSQLSAGAITLRLDDGERRVQRLQISGPRWF